MPTCINSRPRALSGRISAGFSICHLDICLVDIHIRSQVHADASGSEMMVEVPSLLPLLPSSFLLLTGIKWGLMKGNGNNLSDLGELRQVLTYFSLHRNWIKTRGVRKTGWNCYPRWQTRAQASGLKDVCDHIAEGILQRYFSKTYLQPHNNSWKISLTCLVIVIFSSLCHASSSVTGLDCNMR